jgi:hypothetical protein
MVLSWSRSQLVAILTDLSIIDFFFNNKEELCYNLSSLNALSSVAAVHVTTSSAQRNLPSTDCLCTIL